MQKKLIALAVAGLVSAPVFAQSNVTIYGIADAYLGFGKQGGYDLAGVQSGGLSGSRIGFRGTEDLGNGLKGVFVLEQGFNIDTGDANPGVGGKEAAQDNNGKDIVDGDSVFSRQAYVGLSGSFGTVALGRQYAPGYYIVNDPLVSSGVSAHVQMVNDAGMSIAPNSAARWDNAVTYTGSFSGLTVRANYAMATEAVTAPGVDPSDDDRFGLSVAYANGPLHVDAIYHLIQTSSAAATADDQTEWYLSAGYDFGVAKVMASYQDAESLGNAKGTDADAWQVGAVVPVGAAGNVHLAYGELEYDGAGDNKAKTFGLAYTHGLSKRTTAYAGYNYVDNGANTNAGIGYKDLGANGNGKESHLYVVGVRHAF